MEPLQQIYEIFTYLGIYPLNKNPLCRWRKSFQILISLTVFTILLISLISSTVYFIKKFSIDLVNAICAAYQIVGAGTNLYSFIIAHRKRHDLKEIFNEFQTFYDASKLIDYYQKYHFFFKFLFLALFVDKQTDPLKYMQRAEQQGAHLVKYFYKYFSLFMCPASILLTSIGSTFYIKWKNGHIDPNNLYHPLRYVYEWFESIVKKIL